MFVGSFGTPDYTSGAAGWVKSGMRFVACVGTSKLSMDLGIVFCERAVSYAFRLDGEIKRLSTFQSTLL